jgi:hypothetical protein
MVKDVNNKKKRHPFACKILVQFYGGMKFVLLQHMFALRSLTYRRVGWISIAPAVLVVAATVASY